MIRTPAHKQPSNLVYGRAVIAAYARGEAVTKKEYQIGNKPRSAWPRAKDLGYGDSILQERIFIDGYVSAIPANVEYDTAGAIRSVGA